MIAAIRPRITPLVRRFEARYYADPVREHALLLDAAGNVVVARDGERHSVNFTTQELSAACGGMAVHNHPLGRPLSCDDLTCAAENGLTVRAVGINPLGITHAYTASFAAPSRPLADAIVAVYNDAMEVAETELSAQSDAEGWSNELWLQNARHLTNTRLAARFKFVYQRSTRQSLSEASHHELTRLEAFREVERALADNVFAPLHASIVALLNRHSDATGRIAPVRLPNIRRTAAHQVTKAILGSLDIPPLSTHGGHVQAHSPYAATLLSAMIKAASAAVQEQADIMRRYLPSDIVRAYTFSTINPFEKMVSEAGDEPPLQYDPLHEWLGEDNRTLSDRIWNVTGDMRRKLDAYLTDAISAGKPVTQMARELEMYLMPGRKGIRNKRYGEDFSADAMRLARTETAAAYSRASSAAAQLNPFVTGYNFLTAPSHQCCDVCDAVQTGNPYPKDDVTHLPPQHPNCICRVVWIVVKDVKSVVARLRQQVQDAVTNAVSAVTDVIGPLSRRFVHLLFGGKA